jgi:hypothetical protein
MLNQVPEPIRGHASVLDFAQAVQNLHFSLAY